MSTNWKNAVDKINAETFVLPEGWDSRDSIAEMLECSPERVDDHLRPGLKSGRFIKQPMTVWDKILRRNTKVIAYHDTDSDKPVTPAAAIDLDKARELKAAGKSWSEIGTALGCSADCVRSKVRRAG